MLITRGAQGRVYRAIDETTGEPVAIKVVKGGIDADDDAKGRLRREASALKELHHPNIPALREVVLDHDPVYIVTEWVEGHHLENFVRTRRLSVKDKLELFLEVCDALSAAHGKGVLHRDIKPSNILVDDAGTPHVIDFGLAKEMHVELADEPELTQTGQFLGSWAYVSPEQLRGASRTVDARSDVYSLGVVLYEILAGQRPYGLPKDPRKRIGTICYVTPTDPSHHATELVDDIDTIVLRALAKAPPRRYQTVSELAADIRRHLANEPIQARRDSAWYVVWRELKWHPRTVAAVAVALVMFVTYEILTHNAARRLAQERDRAVSAEHVADQQRDIADRERLIAVRRAHAADMKLTQNAWEEGDPQRVYEGLRRWSSWAGQDDLRGFEWYYLLSVAQRDFRVFPVRMHPGKITCSPRENLLATVLDHQPIKLRTIDTGQEVGCLGPRTAHTVVGMAFSPDEKYLATTLRERREEEAGVVLWDLGTRLPAPEQTNRILCRQHLAFSADGRILATQLRRSSLGVWDVPSGRFRAELSLGQDEIRGLQFTPDGLSLVVKLSDAVALVSSNDGTTRRLHRLAPQRPVATIGAGEKVLVAAEHAPGEVRVFDLVDQRQVVSVSYDSANSPVGALAFSPDGRFLAAGDEKGVVWLWDVASSKLLRKRACHVGHIYDLAWSADGLTLATVSADSTMRLTSTTSDPYHQAVRNQVSVIALNFAADPKRVVAFCGPSYANKGRGNAGAVPSRPAQATTQPETAGLSIWGFDGRRPPERFEGQHFQDSAQAAAISARCGLAVVGAPGRLVVMNTASRRMVREIPLPPYAGGRVAITDNGEFVAAVTASSGVAVVNVSSGMTRRLFDAVKDQASALALSWDGELLAVSEAKHGFSVWNVRTGRQRGQFLNEVHVHALRFCPGRDILAVGRDDGWTTICAIERGGRRLQLSTVVSVGSPVLALDFAPDATTLATGSPDGFVRIWDYSIGQERFSLGPGAASITAVSFSDDGHSLASGDSVGRIQVYRVTQGTDAPVYPWLDQTSWSDTQRPATLSRERVVKLGECSDGLDNDGDGLIDYPADPDCRSAQGAMEGATHWALGGSPQCDDDIDNDGDGLVDYPADPSCSSRLDDCEWPIDPRVPHCGNQLLEGNEECDDGNNISGDGCDAECHKE